MKRFMKTMLALLLVACMLLGTVSALATENQPATAAETAIKDKRATALYEDKYTDVTLEVSGIERGNIDVVFVLGGGMTANKETVNSALKVFEPLMKSGKSVVKVAFISLEKGQEIICELTTLNPDTYEEFIKAQFDYMNTLPSGTTNLHSQLVEAKRMLDADTSVEAENKYVFVIATGRTYWFDNADGEQVTIVNKVKIGENTHYYWADYLWRSQRGLHSSLYMIPDKYNNSYEAFMADYEKWIAADGNKYVFNPHFDAKDNAAYANWYANNNKDLKKLGIASGRFGNGIVNPAPTADNFENGVMDAIGSENSPAHALNYERAQYESINVYKALVNAGYNCFAICSESPSYQNGSEYIKVAGYTGTSTAQLGHSFMNYLATLGGQTEAPAVWDFERDAEGNMISNNTVLQEDFFAPIEEKLTSTVAAGSYVVDYIGYNGDAEEGYDFDFIQNADKITLKVGEVAYTTAQVATKEGCTASYTFTAPGADKATFFLDYTYGNGTTEEKFVWSFDEDVFQSAPASLKYTLELVKRSEIPGIHGGDADDMKVYTNQEALLYRKDSKYPEKFNEEEFPMPQVQYNVPGVNVTVNKEWNDNDDSDGLRPDSIIFRLFANGEEIASKEVTANNQWTWTFTNLPKVENGEAIVYTVTEDAVDNYETEMSEPVVAENGDVTVTFTNSYETETIDLEGSKNWDDNNDSDGKRPTEITVHLFANGEEVASKTVTAADNWSWKFEDMPKFFNHGELIAYTVTEDEVADYEATYEEGTLNITNSYDYSTISITGNKTWNDDNNAEGLRPESITIRLLANGVEVASQQVTAVENWAWSFNDMPEYYDGGKVISYTITEDAVAGYTTVVNGYNVTNTLIPREKDGVTVTISGTKYLDDAVAGGFSFILTDDNGRVYDNTVSAANGGIYFLPIQFTEAGVYNYQVSEIAGTDEAIIYDYSVYDITVIVEEGEDALTARVRVYKNGAFYNGPIEFYNATDGLTEIIDEDVPLTGDRNLNAIYVPAMIASIALLGVTVYFTFKKKAK